MSRVLTKPNDESRRLKQILLIAEIKLLAANMRNNARRGYFHVQTGDSRNGYAKSCERYHFATRSDLIFIREIDDLLAVRTGNFALRNSVRLSISFSNYDNSGLAYRHAIDPSIAGDWARTFFSGDVDKLQVELPRFSPGEREIITYRLFTDERWRPLRAFISNRWYSWDVVHG